MTYIRYMSYICSVKQKNTGMKEYKNYRTSDYLEWDSAMSLIRKLYKDKEYTLSLLISCGCFFGLRISDLLSLKWSQVLGESFVIFEKKTNKRRVIKVNKELKEHIISCYKAMKEPSYNDYCFISQKKVVYSTQRINVLLKEIKAKYKLKVGNFSSHSLRKTFGRRVVERSGEQAQMAIIRLQEIFNHDSPKTTKIYLGIREQELLETYDLLDF